MERIGLGKLDVMTVFRRTFANKVAEDPLINSIAKAVGEVIEENNQRLLKDLAAYPKTRAISHEAYK